MQRIVGFLALVLVWAGIAAPAYAGRASASPDYAQMQAAVIEILQSTERLPLPIERVRPALIQHYIRDQGTIYWVGTGRMTPFIQRLADAADDGLNPADYPVDSLIALRDAIDPNDPERAAAAELYYSAFFVAYATDLKIGRVTPQKVDPRLFRSRKTVDVLRILTELKKRRDPGAFLNEFESKNPHYRALKKMLALYRAMAEDKTWPSIPAGPDIKPGASDPRVPAIRKILLLTGDHLGGESQQHVLVRR